MAQELEVDSFYVLDAFKRRDLLSAGARAIAADLDGKDVVAIGGGQDLKALVEALRPLASMIVQGVF
jgi:DNA-binding transcriptional regulator LsrR (DeoR family)